MSTLELTDAERLLSSLDAPACEFGTLGKLAHDCDETATWYGVPMPCGHNPKMLCDEHAEHARAVIADWVALRGVWPCMKCGRPVGHHDWRRI